MIEKEILAPCHNFVHRSIYWTTPSNTVRYSAIDCLIWQSQMRQKVVINQFNSFLIE